MAQSADEDWDWDTDDIRSLDSDELFETRPNRWRGHPASWRVLTEDDRLVARALDGVQSQDLSAHLYNAFAWKRFQSSRRGQVDAPTQSTSDVRKAASRAFEDNEWQPPRLWTAWPLGADVVPQDGLMPLLDDANERFTFRSSVGGGAGDELEESIIASILKSASAAFRRRTFSANADTDSSSSESSNEGAARQPPSLAAEANVREESSGSGMDIMMEDESRQRPEHATESKKTTCSPQSLQPVLSANDALSHAILRPIARHILSDLDKTLAILHYSRAAGVKNLSESGSASEKEEGEEKDVGRMKEGTVRGGLDPIPSGQAEHEMRLQRARRQKKRVTAAADYDLSNGDGPAHAGNTERQPRRNQPSDSISGKIQFMAKWRLKDWSEVMGAAALAGFPQGVIDRSTQRCANLFGQGLAMHTLSEHAEVAKATTTKTYEPGDAITPTSPSDDGEAERLDTEQRRSLSRRRSVPASETWRHYCPVVGCPRAVEGFSRYENYVRHLRLVHGRKTEGPERHDASAPGEQLQEGLHIDGFLKPIEARRGWRGRTSESRRQGRHKPKKRKAASSSSKESSGSHRGPVRRGDDDSDS